MPLPPPRPIAADNRTCSGDIADIIRISPTPAGILDQLRQLRDARDRIADAIAAGCEASARVDAEIRRLENLAATASFRPTAPGGVQ